jgi:transposase-like protein
MSDGRRELLGRLWGSGRSFSEISRAVGHPPGSIFTVVKQTGGYVPAARTRRRGYLSREDREEISRGLARGDSIRRVARTLGRAPSTVSREIARNRGRSKYRAVDAEDRAWRRARRPKVCLLAKHDVLRAHVAAKLAEDWSPEQIAGALRKQYSAEAGMWVSHETIYKSLFVQTRGVLAKELQKHLRSLRPTRRTCITPSPASGARRSATQSRSGSGRPRSRTAPFPGTGKEICCWASRFLSDEWVLELVDFLADGRKPGWFRFAADLLSLEGKAQAGPRLSSGVVDAGDARNRGGDEGQLQVPRIERFLQGTGKRADTAGVSAHIDA